MAEKVSVIILVVDLGCHKCYKKIRKILCQLQDQERMRTVSFDDKSRTVTIIGPFDPMKVACRIRCKAGKVVKDVQIVEGGPSGGRPPFPPPGNSSGKKNSKKHGHGAENPEPAPLPPPAHVPAPEPEMLPPPPGRPPPQLEPGPQMATVMTAVVEKEPPPPRPAEVEHEPAAPPPPSPKQKPPPQAELPPMPLPPHRGPKDCWQPQPPPLRPVEYPVPTVEIPSWPAAPAGPCGCSCCAPCYQGCYEGCRCYSCGRVYGYALAGPTPLPAYRSCRVVCEDDPAACTVM